MKTEIVIIALAVAYLSSGCATKVYVTELPQNVKGGTRIDGIPFRTLEDYQVKLYAYNNSQKKYSEIAVDDTPTRFANKDRIYILHMSASTFSNGKVDFQLDDDNTIKSLQVDSTSTGESALTGLGTGLKNIVTAQSARREAAELAIDEEQKERAATVVAKEDGFAVALDAQQAAVAAQLEVDALLPTASSIDRQKAEAKARKARVMANVAARRAGIALPYPSEPFSG